MIKIIVSFFIIVYCGNCKALEIEEPPLEYVAVLSPSKPSPYIKNIVITRNIETNDLFITPTPQADEQKITGLYIPHAAYTCGSFSNNGSRAVCMFEIKPQTLRLAVISALSQGGVYDITMPSGSLLHKPTLIALHNNLPEVIFSDKKSIYRFDWETKKLSCVYYMQKNIVKWIAFKDME